MAGRGSLGLEVDHPDHRRRPRPPAGGGGRPRPVHDRVERLPRHEEGDDDRRRTTDPEAFDALVARTSGVGDAGRMTPLPLGAMTGAQLGLDFEAPSAGARDARPGSAPGTTARAATGSPTSTGPRPSGLARGRRARWARSSTWRCGRSSRCRSPGALRTWRLRWSTGTGAVRVSATPSRLRSTACVRGSGSPTTSRDRARTPHRSRWSAGCRRRRRGSSPRDARTGSTNVAVSWSSSTTRRGGSRAPTTPSGRRHWRYAGRPAHVAPSVHARRAAPRANR